MKPTYLLYSALFLFSITLLTQNSFAAEDSIDVSVLLSYETGSKASFSDMSFKIYQDLGTKVFKEVSLQSNPFTIEDLPVGHKYKFEAYFKDLYQGFSVFDLKESTTNITFNLKSPGGIKFKVFYNDNTTPLKDANIFVKTMGGKIVSTDKTDLNGDTVVFWIPQTFNNEYYDVDIVIDPSIKFSYKKIQIPSFEQQTTKIVTPWPKVVGSIIPVEVYKDEKTKFSNSDNYVLQVSDKKKNKITESPISLRGDASITSIPIGTYGFHVVSSDGKILASKKVSIIGDTGPIKIFLNDPQLNHDFLYCNCVAFRFDDVQDFYLNNAQIEVLKVAEEANLGITIGVIGAAIGTDQKLVNTIKEQMAKNPRFEVASHSYNHQVNLPLSEEENSIKKTDEKIQEIFNVKPTVFIPPENYINTGIIPILKKYGYGAISSSTDVEIPPKFVKSDFYHFDVATATGILDPTKNIWIQNSPEVIMEKINESLFDYGYAVVMMHPHDFSNYQDGAYVNTVDKTRINDLKTLISNIKSQGYLLTPIGKIDKYKTEKFETTIPITIDERNSTDTSMNCNCVAFKIDNVQDFWLNDVQNKIIDTFSKNNSPVTVSIIGKFFGTDPNSVDFLKQKINENKNISVAIRGWEIVDYTLFGSPEQSESFKFTKDQISTVLGINSNIFSAPFGKFNDGTLKAMKENNIKYISGFASNDKPILNLQPYHVPETSTMTYLLDNDPFFAGNILEKATTKIGLQQATYGYALISMQPSDFAMKDKDGVHLNQIDKERVKQMEDLISHLKQKNIKIVSLTDLPLEASFTKYPTWIKRVYDWNSQGLIDDIVLENAIKYLVSRNIVIPV